MLAPHWLDSIFHSEDCAAAFIASDRFKIAISSAMAARAVHEKFLHNNPGVIGASPDQKARVAFLDSISNP